MRIDFINLAAKQKLEAAGVALAPTWRVFRWESFFDCVVCDGRETTTYAKGKRKGTCKWIGEKKRVIVTESDIKQSEKRYENETGNCHICAGDGQEWFGWSVDSGDRWKVCSRCGGSGKRNSA